MEVIDQAGPRDGLGPTALLAVARRAAAPMAITLVAATAVSVAVGLLIVGPLDASVGRWDLRVVEDLAAGRTDALDRITAMAVVLADTCLVTVLWLASMAVAARVTGGWVVPMFLLFAIGGEKLTYILTGTVVGRPRPPVDALGEVFATTSFPSGHAGSAVVLYGAIAAAVLWHRAEVGRPVPAWSVALSIATVSAIAALVAFSRTYRAQHHPTDVAWGVLLGTAWLVAGWRLVLRVGPEARTGHP